MVDILMENVSNYAMMGLAVLQLSNLLDIRETLARLVQNKAERADVKLSQKYFMVFLCFLATLFIVDTVTNATVVVISPDSEWSLKI
jgi:hypothetical protein